jgi:hypothetical protein
LAFFEYDLVDRRAIVRGDDFHRTFRWLVAGVPVDLTGWSGNLELYLPGSDVPTLTSPLTLGADGTIAWNVGKVLTAGLPKGELTYLVRLTDQGGGVETRVRGRLRVL